MIKTHSASDRDFCLMVPSSWARMESNTLHILSQLTVLLSFLLTPAMLAYQAGEFFLSKLSKSERTPSPFAHGIDQCPSGKFELEHMHVLYRIHFLL